MSLMYAVALLSASLVLARLMYLGSRLPVTPWWAREGLVSFLILAIVGMIALGIGFLLETVLSWERQALGIGHAIAAVGAVVFCAAAWIVLGRALPAPVGGDVIPMPGKTGDAGTSTKLKPRKPRKAA